MARFGVDLLEIPLNSACLPEYIAPRVPRSPFFFTCEHASNKLPDEFHLDAADQHWLDTHWAWDPGAALVTRALASTYGCGAVLARCTRLVCDVNRKIDGPGFMREEVEGFALPFNAALDDDERQRRIQRYYLPYHRTLHDRLQDRLGEGDDPLLLAIHSFTPSMMGQKRPMEVAVVFDEQCPERAAAMIRGFENRGVRVGVNEPYSGIKGQMYSAWYHGRGTGVDYLELEIRQDFFESSAKAKSITAIVSEVLREI